MLRIFGAIMGKGVVIKPRLNIHFPWKLEVGKHLWIGKQAFILNFEKMTIGNNVCISQRSFLCGGNHDYRNPTMPNRNGPNTLKDGCWVRACYFVGPSVNFGKDTLATVGSIIVSNLEENKFISRAAVKNIKTR